MANVSVELNKLVRTNEASEGVTASTFASGDIVKVPMLEKNVVIVVKPSATGNIVVKKGTGLAGVADLTIACTSGKTIAIQLDSSAFEVINGENKGFAILAPAIAGEIVAVNAL